MFPPNPGSKKFPEEMLTHIFAYLPPQETLSLLSVCKRWKIVFDKEYNWHQLCLIRLSSLPKIQDHAWQTHFRLNGPGSQIRNISIKGRTILSAWGRAIAIWKHNRFNPNLWHTSYQLTNQAASINSFDTRNIGLSQFLIAGCSDNKIHIWHRIHDSSPYIQKETLEEHQSPVTAIRGYGNDGSLHDKMLKIWKRIHAEDKGPSLELVASAEAHTGGITDIAAAPFSNLFYTTGKDKTIKEWFVSDRSKLSGPKVFSLACDDFPDALRLRYEQPRKIIHNIYYLASSRIFRLSMQQKTTYSFAVNHPEDAKKEDVIGTYHDKKN